MVPWTRPTIFTAGSVENFVSCATSIARLHVSAQDPECQKHIPMQTEWAYQHHLFIRLDWSQLSGSRAHESLTLPRRPTQLGHLCTKPQCKRLEQHIGRAQPVPVVSCGVCRRAAWRGHRRVELRHQGRPVQATCATVPSTRSCTRSSSVTIGKACTAGRAFATQAAAGDRRLVRLR